jgi:hypothetical protein
MIVTGNIDSWLKRAKEFKSGQWSGYSDHSTETLMFAISITSALHGAASPQMEILKARTAHTGDGWDLYQVALGVIANVISEIEGGLVAGIRLGITGEVLGDLIAIAQEALSEGTIEVAAVLTAAAFEDLMRRLAQEKAGITSRIKLELILHELKDKNILQGGESALANGFLKFRNDSLHANWNSVKEPQITSCLALLNSLIVKHLG